MLNNDILNQINRNIYLFMLNEDILYQNNS